MIQAITLKIRSNAYIFLVSGILFLSILAPRLALAQGNACPDVLIVNEVLPGPIGYVIENEQGQIIANAPIEELPPTCDLIVGERYKLTPFRPGNDMDSVTTFDLITISRFLIGYKSNGFTFGQHDASDVNQSSNVSPSDMVLLRDFILHPYKELTQKPTWAFFPKAVADASHAMPFNSENLFFTYTGPDQELEFKSIKTGRSRPENKYYDTHFPLAGTLFFDVSDIKLIKGKTYTIPFQTNDFTNIIGYQLALQLEPYGLEILEWLPGLHAPFSHVGLVQPIKGLVTTLHTNDLAPPGSHSLPNGEVLFSIKVKARANGKLSQFLRINREVMLSEAYNRDDEFMDADLHFTGLSTVNKDVVGHVNAPGNPFHEGAQAEFRSQTLEEGTTPQFWPNPFRHELHLNFWQYHTGETIIRITDLMGRDVVVQQRSFTAGHQQWIWHADHLIPPGHYIASIIQGEEVHTVQLLKQ